MLNARFEEIITLVKELSDAIRLRDLTEQKLNEVFYANYSFKFSPQQIDDSPLRGAMVRLLDGVSVLCLDVPRTNKELALYRQMIRAEEFKNVRLTLEGLAQKSDHIICEANERARQISELQAEIQDLAQQREQLQAQKRQLQSEKNLSKLKLRESKEQVSKRFENEYNFVKSNKAKKFHTRLNQMQSRLEQGKESLQQAHESYRAEQPTLEIKRRQYTQEIKQLNDEIKQLQKRSKANNKHLRIDEKQAILREKQAYRLRIDEKLQQFGQKIQQQQQQNTQLEQEIRDLEQQINQLEVVNECSKTMVDSQSQNNADVSLSGEVDGKNDSGFIQQIKAKALRGKMGCLDLTLSQKKDQLRAKEEAEADPIQQVCLEHAIRTSEVWQCFQKLQRYDTFLSQYENKCEQYHRRLSELLKDLPQDIYPFLFKKVEQRCEASIIGLVKQVCKTNNLLSDLALVTLFDDQAETATGLSCSASDFQLFRKSNKQQSVLQSDYGCHYPLL